MSDLEQVLKAGSLLVITAGHDEDHWFGGPMRVLRDFTMKEAADGFRRTMKHQYPDSWKFGAWLAEHEFVTWEDCTTWRIGKSSSIFEPEDVE